MTFSAFPLATIPGSGRYNGCGRTPNTGTGGTGTAWRISDYLGAILSKCSIATGQDSMLRRKKSLNEITDLSGKTCMVTGSTSGHGRAVALALAGMGADMVLMGRNKEKCEAVCDEIRKLTG